MVVFIESSCIIAYCRGKEDDFNAGAITLYEKLIHHRGIITEIVKNQITVRLNELIGSTRDKRYANSIVFKRGKFLDRVEELEINNKLKERKRIKEIQQALEEIDFKKKQEIMFKKRRTSLLPETTDIIIGAQATVLKEELGESPFYLASTDQDFTFLMVDILENYDVYVDFPGSIARRL
jgi:hypothetical protein